MEMNDSCIICDDLMIDQNIIEYEQAACLKLTERSKFPVCDIEVQESARFKEMEKKCLNNLSEKIFSRCDGCNDNEGVKFCVDCKFNYCSTCLKPHDRIPASNGHILVPIKSTNEYDNECTTCEVHLKAMDLYCEGCKVISCGECVSLNHVDHKIKHVSEHFYSILKKLNTCFEKNQKFLKKVFDNFENTEKLSSNNEVKASNMKKQIKNRGEDIKRAVNSIVKKLNGDIDAELQKHNQKIENVLLKLKELENISKSNLEFLEQEINELNYSNISLRMPQQKTQRIESSESYSGHFNIFHFCKTNVNFNHLQTFLMALKEVHQDTVVKSINLKHHVSLGVDAQIVTLPFSMASNGDEVYISRGTNIIHVFSCDKLTLKKNYNCKEIDNIIDMLTANGKLFTLGRCKNNHNQNYIVIIKNDALFCEEPCELFRLPSSEDNIKLSKSSLGLILLVFKKEIFHISEDGELMKKIDLKFVVSDAIQVDDACYVGHGEMGMCIIDGDGNVSRFNPSTRDHLPSKHSLEMDNFGFLYLADEFGGISVFDRDLNLVYNYNATGSLRCWCYNEARHVLLTVCRDGTLSVIKI